MKKISFLSLLFIHPAFAEMMCDISVTDYYAGYAINTYNCDPGQFLPANALGCAPCPNGFTCPGGTFGFNPDMFEGITLNTAPTTQMNNVCAANFPSDLAAIYTPNTHTCSPGYYLPANVDECTQCPAGNYCVGGTYSFNETINQGIEPCATGYSSDAGATSCTPNTIFITWDHADSTDITANNAGSVTYGGDIRTPQKAQHINGKIFTGWTFNVPQ